MNKRTHYGKQPFSSTLKEKTPHPSAEIRLNRFIANAGICSRREADKLIEKAKENLLKFNKLNDVSEAIQNNIDATKKLETYALNLWKASSHPEVYNIKISGVDVNRLIISGASPRGISMMIKCARVNAWLNNRSSVLPEDIHAVFHETIAHRLVFNPVYDLRRTEIARELTHEMLTKVSAP